MPWCPTCKSEYREGFMICADCGGELVDDKTYEKLEAERRIQKQSADELQAADEEQLFQNMADEGQLFQNPANVVHPIYRDNSRRASENRSSGWILLVLGSLGLAGVGLGILGVIPLKFGNIYLTYGVMTAIFLLFFIAGAMSIKDAGIFEKKAESENSLKDILLEWCRENLHGDELDRQIGAEEILVQEILYLKRFECIKGKLNHQFVNLEQGFLDNLIENCVYDMVFGEMGTSKEKITS